jgi:hypothetical protein
MGGLPDKTLGGHGKNVNYLNIRLAEENKKVCGWSLGLGR